jgi:hypothetical protein
MLAPLLANDLVTAKSRVACKPSDHAGEKNRVAGSSGDPTSENFKLSGLIINII